MAPEFTDTALDMADIIRVLLKQPGPNQPTWNVIQATAAVPASEYWNLCAVIGERLEGLKRLISRAPDPDFKLSQKRAALQAIERFAHTFAPNHAGAPWQQTVASYVKDEDATVLEFVSIIVQRHQPLRKLNEEERPALIEKVDQALQGLNGETADLPEWSKAPLNDGLTRLKFLLQHLKFFGCDTAIEALSSMHRMVSGIETAIVRDELARGSEPKRSRTLVDVLNAIAVIAAVFNAPDQTMTAFERYKGWVLDCITASLPALPIPSQHYYIGGPKPSEPNPADIGAPDVAVEPQKPEQTENKK